MNFIDLFAGAGGLSEGFIRAGFKPVAHVEMDKAACNTLLTRSAFHFLKSNKQVKSYEKYLSGDLTREELHNKLPKKEKERVINLALGKENNKEIFSKIDAILGKQKVDLIIGGPPCQAYSLVGRARSSDGMKNDPRNHLYLEYAKFLKKYQPKIFVFENVMGLYSAGGSIYFEKMKKKFDEVGYELQDYKVNSKDFGVLQNRKRIILIGKRKDVALSFPDLNVSNHLTYPVSSILSDLKPIQAGGGKDKGEKYNGSINEYLKKANIRNGMETITQHISRPHSDHDKTIYRLAVKSLYSGTQIRYNDLPEELKTHNNRKTFLDRFKVVDPNINYAQTVVAHISKDGHYYIHPDIKQNRSISVREAARLQSFPDDFYFEGVKEGQNRTAAFKQIGNAVPPLMAEKIAISIKYLLLKCYTPF